MKAPQLDIDEQALRRQLERAAEKKQKIATARVFDTGDDLLNRAQANVPHGDTNELAESLSVEKRIGRDGPECVLRAEADHSVPVEFGTSDTPAQPFFRPALAEGPSLLKRRSRRR